MATLPVPVGFNYNNGSPIWTVQEKITVAHGQDDTIQWNLTCTGLPTGSTGRFSLTNPINFVVRKNGKTGAAWSGQPPTRNSDSQVQVDDDNANATGQTQHYYYNVSVDVVNGSNVTTFTDDPEIENPGT